MDSGPIDERDVDKLLAMLMDRQIADLFDMTEDEVARIRRSRREQFDRSTSRNRDDVEREDRD